jgi:hypothetical protein
MMERIIGYVKILAALALILGFSASVAVVMLWALHATIGRLLSA